MLKRNSPSFNSILNQLRYITAPYTKNNNSIGYDLLDCRERYVNGVGVTGLAGNPKEHTTLQHKYYF